MLVFYISPVDWLCSSWWLAYLFTEELQWEMNKNTDRDFLKIFILLISPPSSSLGTQRAINQGRKQKVEKWERPRWKYS